MDESHSPSRLHQILEQLASNGLIEDHELDSSDSDKLTVALARCVASLHPEFNFGSIETLAREDILNRVQEALRSMKCPHNLESSQIQNLDSEAISPVVQWLLDRAQTSLSYCNDEDRRKEVIMNELQSLRKTIHNEGVESKVEILAVHMRSLKDLERQESEFWSCAEASRSQLELEVIDLKEKIASASNNESVSEELDLSLCKSTKELDVAKKELAATLRAILSTKHRLDDVPSQSEIAQYERRFSELYGHIQGKHQQTQKYYDTYNALLEIKELMLKETSLLSSISSQFQSAITSMTGRSKLIDSMEGILKSSQQKLEKVQVALEEQQRTRDTLKERYSSAIAAQRH